MLNSNSALKEPGIINAALFSFGMSGLVFHAPFLQAHPGFNLYGVWERTNKTASRLYPAIISFDSLEALLADDQIDLVIVNTPNYTHVDFARKALLAGMHVLVEKSFTVTVSEAEELIQLASERDRQLAVFQNRRYDSDFKTVRKIVEAGSLGKINEAAFHFDRYKPEPSAKLHKETPIPGAGLLHDLGPHIIDQALLLFGMPESVFGYQKKMRPGTLVNDYFDITLFYDDLQVRLKAGLLVMEQSASYFIHGVNGSFIKERADIQEDMLKLGHKPGATDWGTEPASAAGTLTIKENGTISRKKIQSETGNYMQFFDELYEAIVHEEPLPVTAMDGLHVMQVIEAVIKSDQEKMLVPIKKILPDSRSFNGK